MPQVHQCIGTDKAGKQKQNQEARLGSFLWEIPINLGIDYKTIKFIHVGDKYIYMYELPLKNYAVVQYEADDETIAFSQFFFDWVDALHCFNLLRKETD